MKTGYIAALYLALLATVNGMYAEAPSSPNILFFLVDDMGVTDTSVRFVPSPDGGFVDAPLNARYRTPSMERLARQGRRFVNAHAYSVCTPTRASLLTGQEAPRLRITTWTDPQVSADTGKVNEGGLHGPAWCVSGVDPELPTLPSVLADAGYRTIHAGKAHFGPNDTPAGDPLNLGFHVNIAGHGAGGPGSYWGEKNYSAAWRRGGNRWDVPGLEKYHGTKTFLTEAITLEMKAAIQDAVEQDKPFFSYMSHYAVHAPFETDARFAANYPELKGKALAFATLVEGMDKSLGDLLDHLNDLGVAEETLVIFFSDNGSDGPPNLPLKGIKGTRFEGGNRVPMIVAWAKPDPEHPLQKALSIQAGSIEDDLVIPADFFPTIVKLAGSEIPEGTVVDGKDIAPYFKGTPGTHRPQKYLVHFPHGRHRNHLFTTWTDGDWKLIYEHAYRRWQLTNLADDIGEAQNQLDEKPQLALKMAQEMIRELDRQQAQYPVSNETGRPVKPDLSAIEKAIQKQNRE